MAEIDHGACYLVRPDEDRILVSVRSPHEKDEHSVSIPWDVWIKMIHGHGKVDALKEIGRLRERLEAIAGFGSVNLSGEYEHGLRDIIRSMTNCARDALSSGERTDT